MDRLTQIVDGEVVPDMINAKVGYKDCMRKLAEYEDLEEQGRLIKLPCKIWDTVYIVDGEAILEETVLGFSTSNTKSGETVTTMTATYDCYFTKPNINDLGVLHGGNQLSFFLAREEAEAALAMMKGEREMTENEAKNNYEYIIKCLEKRRMAPCGFCKSDKCVPNPHECTKDDFVIDKAIEVLEKQIPKKPITNNSLRRDRHGNYFLLDDYETDKCPSCNEDIISGITYRANYCSHCGQALDWGR